MAASSEVSAQSQSMPPAQAETVQEQSGAMAGCACRGGMSGAGMGKGSAKMAAGGMGHQGMAGCGMHGKGMASGAEGSSGACCQGGVCRMGAMAKGTTDGQTAVGAGPSVMRSAMSLVQQRAAIERRVEEIEGGIRSVTTSDDPAMADLIERHVRQVADLVARGGRMRAWDPLFSAIFDEYEQIDIQIERIENGVVVKETSSDPWVTALIRAHAAKVDDFLARGPAAVHEPTPLPERPEGTE